MKNSLLILTCLKKTNICGVYRCRKKSLNVNLNGRSPHFLLQLFLLFVGCANAQPLGGTMLQWWKQQNVKHPDLFRTPQHVQNMCMIYCGIFKMLWICCVICNLQICGVSRMQIVGFSRLQIVALISSSLMLGLRLGLQFANCWVGVGVGVGFPISKFIDCWIFQCLNCCILWVFNLQIIKCGVGVYSLHYIFEVWWRSFNAWLLECFCL
jgi:hypothetical protein